MSRLLPFPSTEQHADGLSDADTLTTLATFDLKQMIDDLTILALMRPMAIVVLARLAHTFARPFR